MVRGNPYYKYFDPSLPPLISPLSPPTHTNTTVRGTTVLCRALTSRLCGTARLTIHTLMYRRVSGGERCRWGGGRGG